MTTRVFQVFNKVRNKVRTMPDHTLPLGGMVRVRPYRGRPVPVPYPNFVPGDLSFSGFQKGGIRHLCS